MKKPYSTPMLTRIEPSRRAEWTVVTMLTIELQQSAEALRTLLEFWDRKEQSWTAAETERLAAIRTLVNRFHRVSRVVLGIAWTADAAARALNTKRP